MYGYVPVIFLHNLAHESLKSPSTEAYTELCQMSNMVVFAKIGHGYKPLIIFAKCSILDV